MVCVQGITGHSIEYKCDRDGRGVGVLMAMREIDNTC